MKILLVLFVALAFCSVAVADEIYVPDNNKTTGSVNVIPFSGPWPGSSNPNGEWRYQWWIPAVAMGGKSGLIKEVSVVSNYTGVLTAATCEYSMGHNTAAAASTTFATNLPTPTVCYPAGPYTWSATKGNWAPVGLKSGFVYNGTDNLVIEVRFKGSAITGATYLGCFYDNKQPNNGQRLYKYGPGAYTAATGSGVGTSPNGLRVRLTIDTITITASGKPVPGGTVTLDLSAPADGGLAYQIGSSLGTGPIPIDSRQLGLSPDAILMASVNGWMPTVFKDYTGYLDAAGKGKGTLNIPNIPILVGIKVHSAFVTLDSTAPSGVKSISPTETISITP